MNLVMLPGDLFPINESENTPVVYDHHPLYRTELCRNWKKMGACAYGVKCQVSLLHAWFLLFSSTNVFSLIQFAHGRVELRATVKHTLHKTKVCHWMKKGVPCPYGRRCRFIHPYDDLCRELSIFYLS